MYYKSHDRQSYGKFEKQKSPLVQWRVSPPVTRETGVQFPDEEIYFYFLVTIYVHCTIHCTIYTVQGTVYNVYCTVYNILVNLKCTFTHCTTYDVRYRQYECTSYETCYGNSWIFSVVQVNIWKVKNAVLTIIEVREYI